jgi:tetratricopeptide (TPR) repeat protein
VLPQLDQELAEAIQADQPARQVALCVARFVSLWRGGDVAGCDDALQEAERDLDRVPGTEREALTEICSRFKSQMAAATGTRKAESVRLHAEASVRWQAGEHAEALALLQQALAASVQEQNRHHQVMCLLAIGQALLATERTREALRHLQEGLEVAADLNDQDLLRALRDAVTRAMTAAALEENLQRPLDEVLAEAESDEKKAVALLARARGLARRDATEATVLIERALELAQQSGEPRLRVAGHRLRGELAASAGKTTEAQQDLAAARRIAEEAQLHEEAGELAQIMADLQRPAS